MGWKERMARGKGKGMGGAGGGGMLPSRAPCKLPQPPCSVLARARRMSALILIRLISSFRRSSFCSFSSASPSSPSSSANSTTPSSSPSLPAPFLPDASASRSSFLFEGEEVEGGGPSSRSSASRDFVASSTAAFQSTSLRWQAATLDLRTAISYSR